MSEAEQPDSPPPNPVKAAINEIDGESDESLRGHDRLGALAFDEMDVARLREISSLLSLGMAEDQGYWGGGFRSAFRDKGQEILEAVTKLKALQSDTPNAAAERDEIRNALASHFEWVLEEVQPRLFDKRIRDHLESARPATEAEAQRQQELADRNDALQARIDELERKLSGMEPVVEAQRAAAAEETTEELSREYTRQANEHRDAWKLSLKILIGVGTGAIVAGIALLIINRPTGAKIDGETVARLAIDVYVIGLLLYAVRVASLQFRAHRHLEAKARSKAAALSTFSRFVASGAEPSTRDVVAQTLAQSVFESGDTGFVESGSDQITLIERVIGPAVQRASSAG
jgi:hypothetical protein